MPNFSTSLIIIASIGCTYLHAQENLELNPVKDSPLLQQSQEHRITHSTRTGALTALGHQLFHDKQLSASGKLSCASCHQEHRAFTPDNQQAVQNGGTHMQLKGTRAVPTLMYLQSTPPFSEHYVEDEGLQPGLDNGPAGGFTWDGRVNTLAEQAKIPLFSNNEMASNASILAKRIQDTYKNEFIDLFGKDSLQSDAEIINGIVLALQTYQQDSTVFGPYTSKFDLVMQAKAIFTPLEEQGFRVFMDPHKGNCASCHPASVVHGAMPQFTDHGYAALGVPRNMKIPENHKYNYYDLGLCGPARQDLAEDFCGFFKVPTLRNVALKKSFFHNGLVHSLKEAVRFYAERDTAPEKWYPKTKSGVRKYNDLPLKYQKNIETKAPFGQKTGENPVLSDHDITAIVAFLNTLTDQTLANTQQP